MLRSAWKARHRRVVIYRKGFSQTQGQQAESCPWSDVVAVTWDQAQNALGVRTSADAVIAIPGDYADFGALRIQVESGFARASLE